MASTGNNDIQHVYIVGSKGIPAAYGGYETFVEQLTAHRVSDRIRYHVACAVDEPTDEPTFEHNGAECFRVLRRPIGSARAITYDLDALAWCVRDIERRRAKHPVVYVLACRVGPFIGRYARKIHALGGQLWVNPDGHEWLRAKWSAPVRRYWKLSEAGMTKHADLMVCDSENIERYIQGEYARFAPKTTFAAYGADVAPSTLADDDPTWTGWLAEHGLEERGYYLVVGRFVPENNYETMIREFMASKTKRAFALVTNVNEQFLAELEERTHWKSDPRIKFVGTVYDQQLLKKVREGAFAYFHGHEVGGTNPSLLEALASTRLNLLLDVGFNREVAQDSALYWTKEPGSLASLIERVEELPELELERLGAASTQRIRDAYSWDAIVGTYERLFLGVGATR